MIPIVGYKIQNSIRKWINVKHVMNINKISVDTVSEMNGGSEQILFQKCSKTLEFKGRNYN